MQNLPLELRIASYTYVPCGKCEACLSRRRKDWSFRLMKETENCKSAFFVTLTYDDEHLNHIVLNRDGFIDYVPVVSKTDVQKFLKRLRKRIEPFKIRYFLVSEYGPTTLRPHYHMLLFDFPLILKDKLDEYLTDAWQLGFIRVDPINEARINYVTSYCLDSSTLPDYLVKNFMLCSRRPAIGSSYLDDDRNVSFHLDNMDSMVTLQADREPFKQALPRYYRDKIFSDDEKFALASQNVARIYRENTRLREKQRRWLISNGYEPSELNLKTPLPFSPLKKELDKVNAFTSKVRAKNKMNKKKL